MSFQQGLSGLSGAQRALDATSNNVANAATVGFKQAGAQFADIFAASLNGATGSQVGIGTMVGQVAQQFTQGNITVTNNALDVAINGGGFFRMSDSGTITYSRNGQFLVDKDGFIVNAQGLHLTGYAVDSLGTIIQGATTDLSIPTADISPNTSTASNLVLNLDSRSDTPSAMTSGTLAGNTALTSPITIDGTNDTLNLTVDGTNISLTIPQSTTYTPASLAAQVQTLANAALTASGQSVTVNLDATNILSITSDRAGLGSGVVLAGGTAGTTLFGTATATAGADNFSITNPSSYTSSTSQTVFDTKGNPHTFTMYFAKTATAGQWKLYTSLDGSTPTGATNVSFDSNGRLLTSMPLSQSFPITNGASSPLAFTLDFTGSTEYGNVFGVSQMLQDGYTSGRLSGISISPEGVIKGNYSNGQTTNLGQVVLANFANPNGLISLGGNQWAESFSSGQPIVGVPTSGSLGVLQAAAVEEANVDLTSEMVNMITQQRNYQANAQSIKTQDQMLQTLVNLR